MPLKIKFNLTNNAHKHFTKVISQENEACGIILGIKDSGCSGLSYTINLAKHTPNPELEQFVIENLSIFINPEQLYAFKDVEIDYVIDGLNSMIKFNNPNAHSECGCGESFQLKEQAK